MQIFKAKLLFDGEKWLSDKYFQVGEDGLFQDLELGQIDDDIKDNRVQLGVVIPGFVNCHSHSFQRAMAGLGERISNQNTTDSFWTWREQMYRLAHWLTPVTFRVITDWLYIEMLESGYTSVGEFHYLHKTSSGKSYDNACEMALQVIDSAQTHQIRLCLLPVLYQQGGIGKPLFPKQKPFGMETLEEYHHYFQKLSSQIPIDFNVGIVAHSIRAVSEEALLELSKEYGKQDIPIHIHIAEQPAEVEESLQYYQKRSVDFLFDTVEITPNWTLIHATHISSDELERIIISGPSVGLCPITEANLGDGIFPAQAFLKDGGHTAIGSDSNIRIDPFEELRTLEYSQRYHLGVRACLANEEYPSSGYRVAHECYYGGAKSLKMPIGKLKNGFYADFVVLWEDHPSMIHLNPETLWDELIYAGSRELIQDVYVSGKQIVSHGKHKQRAKGLHAFRQVLSSSDFPKI